MVRQFRYDSLDLDTVLGLDFKEAYPVLRSMKAIFCIVLFLIASSALLAQAEALDTTPRIAIVSAFEPEFGLLLSRTEVENEYTVNGVTFTTGTLAGNDVVLFLSGVSTVNAAMNTQVALDRFNITHLIFSGIAGGVNPELNIGDVIVSAQWGQYLEMAYARDNGDGTYAPPPFFAYEHPNFEFMFPRPVTVFSDTHPEGESRFWFPVDADMLAVAEAVAADAELTQCADAENCLTDAPRVLVGGNGVSGPVFVDNAEFRDYTFATFEASVLDMETASTAMVAYANGVPFIAFRSLSDLAGGGPGENEMGTFFAIAADNSATVVIDFLSAWENR